MMNRGVPHTQELGIQIPLLYLLEAPIYHEQLYFQWDLTLSWNIETIENEKTHITAKSCVQRSIQMNLVRKDPWFYTNVLRQQSRVVLIIHKCFHQNIFIEWINKKIIFMLFFF